MRHLTWLLPGLLLLAVGLGVAIVLQRPGGVLTVVLAVMLIVPVVWIAASALWPATADRRCPRCGADGLERLDAESTYGLECRECGWRDEDASSWLLAEEEGPLEDVVLRQRGRRPPRVRNRSRRAVDSPRPSD